LFRQWLEEMKLLLVLLDELLDKLLDKLLDMNMLVLVRAK